MGNKDMAEEKIWSLIGFLEVSPARKKLSKLLVMQIIYCLPTFLEKPI